MVYLGFWVLATCKKNLVALFQKLWIFLWCLTFASYYPAQKTELWLAKVRHKKKIHNFWDRVTKFFLQVDNTQKPKHTKFGCQIKAFIVGKIHFCVRGSILFFPPCISSKLAHFRKHLGQFSLVHTTAQLRIHLYTLKESFFVQMAEFNFLYDWREFMPS